MSRTGWVGPAIRSARERRGLSQAALAELLGTSPANVSRWETGAAMPGLDRLPALCDALDVTADYFRRAGAPDGASAGPS